MCLTLTISRIKNKPIKVYKVLVYPELESPTYSTFWKFDEVKTERLYDIAGTCSPALYSKNLAINMHTGFHSYRKLERAYNHSVYAGRIFEAVIPANTPYVYGNDQEVLSQALLIRPYWYKPVSILGFQFFIRQKIRTS